MMRISLIAAVSENGVIGRDNKLPWRLPDDLVRFKMLTLGKPLVMGRRTWESLRSPLPDRTSIVVSRNPAFRAPGAIVARSVDQALVHARGHEEVMIIGGARLYQQLMEQAHTLYLTRVHAKIEGDTFFPPIDAAEWNEVDRVLHAADDRHEHAFTFIDLIR